jgi:uncharacterized BrkB/YihY/UPF0761 family membrane protein
MKNTIFSIILLLQLALIVSIVVINYQYRASGSAEWIDRGYVIMSYLRIPITFFVLTLFAAIFFKAQKVLRFVVALFAVIGVLIFNKVYLYPF